MSLLAILTGLLPFFINQCLAESLVNVAKDKPVSYGSIESIIQKTWANDGSENSNCFKSAETGDKFWEVDLIYPSFVIDLEIKSDNLANELLITIYDRKLSETKKSLPGTTCSKGCKLSIKQEVRKIRISMTGKTALQLCEVKAFGILKEVQAVTTLNPGATTRKIIRDPQAMSTLSPSGTTSNSKLVELNKFTYFVMISMVLLTKCI